MKNNIYFISCLLIAVPLLCTAQEDTTENQSHELQRVLDHAERIHIEDSIKKANILEQYNLLRATDKLEKEKLLSEIKRIERTDSLRKAEMLDKVKALKKTAIGYPVTLFADTLFLIHTKLGASTPQDRAANISRRINKLYDDDFLKIDSLVIEESDNTLDIVFGDLIIMSVSDLDAVWYNRSKQVLANEYAEKIKSTIIKQKENNSIIKTLIRIGLVLIVISGIGLLIWLIGKGHTKTAKYITGKKDVWLKSLSYKDYTFLTADQELKVVQVALKIVKWFLDLVLLYLVLPIVFSIFPFTRGWADDLFGLVWSPFKGIFMAIWDYLPNLFSILVIFIVMKYFIRFVKYIFSEIESGKLNISGFHADWAMPTFGIVRFLLYAFMFVLIFPYLPGSDSDIFKGVSVFIGILFSLGSSSAIANMVAGLVITYMRPFKIGDRIKIGDVTGDVIEKTLLVTRLRTIKNEEITIPNSAVLSGNTTNYSAYAKSEGLIIHTTVTIGYDVSWKAIHKALIEAALKTDLILHEPMPFVLQTSLDDFYVSYQINAYTEESGKLAIIYSDLHKHIQDVCNEKGIEIMSPHYKASRDGNSTTIPAQYLPAGYEAPGFKVVSGKREDKDKK